MSLCPEGLYNEWRNTRINVIKGVLLHRGVPVLAQYKLGSVAAEEARKYRKNNDTR